MQINKLSDDKLPLLADLASDRKLMINELSELGGVTGAAVEGMVLDIKKGSGLIYRCSECKRVLQKNMCMVHGKQEGVPDLRIKAVIDDGTGTLSTVIAKEVTEKILERSLEDCESLIYKTRNLEIINEELINKLIAQPVRVHGNIIIDDYGLMMICNDAELIEIDVKTEATKLLESLASEGGYSYASNT
jgi:replication factor A1